MTNEIATLANNILAKIDLTKAEFVQISKYANDKVFQKLIDEIMRIKKDQIIEECGIQEELNNARLTLQGNREVKEIISLIDSKYKQEVQNNKEDEEE